jgi:hypothetical protein
VKVPTVHLNGTSKAGLMDPIGEALTALNAALEALWGVAPNARDYYVQTDPDAFSKAAAEHRGRVDRLTDVKNELGEILIGIDEQEG